MKLKKKIQGGGGVRLGEGSGCQSGCERRSDAFFENYYYYFFIFFLGGVGGRRVGDQGGCDWGEGRAGGSDQGLGRGWG